MRMTAATLALLAIAATAAMAQVPRTINYQGRIADGPNPVNGNRWIEVRLYTSETGGTPIYSERHESVEFKEGIFTVGIGTQQPIPESVTFDGQYWLGVTIEDFNSSNELSPRYILRSSPYSFRADIADSAVNAWGADEAKTLTLPAALEAASADPATLKVVNAGGTAILAQGQRYAIISEGVDSTTRHYAPGEVVGTTAAPSPGALYRDNAPIAWGLIQPDGSIVSDFGIASVQKPSDQGYEITLDNPVRLVTYGTFVVPAVAPVILPGGHLPPTTEQARVFAMWNFKRNPTGDLNPRVIVVRFIDIQGATISIPFSIVIFGRPE